MKICIKCKQTKTFSGFSAQMSNLDGYKVICKVCQHEYYANYWKTVGKVKNLAQKIVVLSHYSDGIPTCACCRETAIEFLSLDHLEGGGYIHRKSIHQNIYTWIIKNNFPKNFRTLCMNCNFSIGKYGYCPHTRTN